LTAKGWSLAQLSLSDSEASAVEAALQPRLNQSVSVLGRERRLLDVPAVSHKLEAKTMQLSIDEKTPIQIADAFCASVGISR
jgi:hypothetical protein